MAQPVLGNFAITRLVSPPSGTTGLSFSVTAAEGAKFPVLSGTYFYGVFSNTAQTAFEIVKISARSTDTFTIESGGRGKDSTTAATWNVGDLFYYPSTRVMLNELLAQAVSDATVAAQTYTDSTRNNAVIPGNQVTTSASDQTKDVDIAQRLRWIAGGNNKLVVDNSNATYGSGGTTNSTNAWVAGKPVLMGWDGSTTWGVRVDISRRADTAGTIDSQANSATISATATNTAGNIVLRDGSGNFAANVITAAAFTGTASAIVSQANSATITATSANNPNQIVLRDGSGNFNAGTITATLNGQSNSIAGQANSATTSAVSTNTVSTIVLRDGSGNFSAGTITASLSGNATTASTASTITSQANSATITAASTNTINTIVLRDGSGNFSAGTISAALSGQATTISGQANSATITAATANTASTIVLRDGSGNFNAGTITATLIGQASTIASQANSATINATSANTASTIVLRDGSGNFTAGTITAALSGNATTATTANAIVSQANSATITAAVANTASTIVLRDGSGNFSAGTITATLSGQASTIVSQANSATTTATSANTANTIVLRDSSGNFNAGTITAALSGNATTATNFSGQANSATITADTTAFSANTIVRRDANGRILGLSQESTEQATTSGTSFDFAIGAGARMVVLQLRSVSTVGTSAFLVQMGDAGGIETTGYSGMSLASGGSGQAPTNGFALTVNSVASSKYTGNVLLVRANASSNTWVFSANISAIDIGGGTAQQFYISSGEKATSQELTTVRLTSVAGDGFDLGAVDCQIFY